MPVLRKPRDASSAPNYFFRFPFLIFLFTFAQLMQIFGNNKTAGNRDENGRLKSGQTSSLLIGISVSVPASFLQRNVQRFAAPRIGVMWVRLRTDGGVIGWCGGKWGLRRGGREPLKSNVLKFEKGGWWSEREGGVRRK
jgi:hypothetical protein